MKRIPLFFLLAMSPLNAQDNTSSQTAVEQLLPSQKEFLNLPEDQRKEFITHFSEASRYFQQKRIFETLEALDKAEKVFVNSAELWNLKGSCYVEMRAFDKATAAFAKALELNPENVSIQFNIAEVYFVTKQWQKANDLFEEILKKTDPKNTSLGRLVEFKILLGKIKLGLENEVQILAEKYDYLDDSPYYYYSQAALAYEKEDLLAAEEWLARANRIFRDPNILAPWQDTLVEFGYIKSFYGEPDTSPSE
ncbi:tetratricopeptide repeat protein [Luteolibacter algae]|uniref:Tetratricopeptide repeat protein n=1 Tax=Luteolibacter algae TaxID=454151 RepID=A0ABW5D931_9BACT